jgi:hypothetical protein
VRSVIARKHVVHRVVCLARVENPGSLKVPDVRQQLLALARILTEILAVEQWHRERLPQHRVVARPKRWQLIGANTGARSGCETPSISASQPNHSAGSVRVRDTPTVNVRFPQLSILSEEPHPKSFNVLPILFSGVLSF